MSEEKKEEQQNESDPKILFGYIPTMLEVVRSNEDWGRRYNDIAQVQSDAQEQMKDHELSRFHSVAAEVVGRLEIAGLAIDEISEETGLRVEYIGGTLEALSLTKKGGDLGV